MQLAEVILFALATTVLDPDVLKVRDAAWRAWFGGDEPALRTLLPEDFLAISAGGAEISNLQKTIASSRSFKESGGRLVSLNFPETQAQVIGDTVILYGSYEATSLAGGEEKQMKGRLTEIFVKRGGKWVHPGWHLDVR